MMNTLTLKDLPAPPPGKSGWPWTKFNELLPEKIIDKVQLPRLSIVTPSYNQGKFLEATIRSVLLQGYPNLEYIIIDGGSTDNSIDIIKKYENYLFYWQSQKDKGQADAVNQGLRRSNGEIIGWINSDDVYVKGTFHKIVKAFYNHPDCIVVHGNRILINNMGDVTGWMCLPPFDPETFTYNICSETVFWRRSAMQEVGFMNINLQFALDLEFFCRLYKSGKFLKLNEYLGYFRCHPKNKSSTIYHIGQEEAQREWKRLFGSEKINDEAQTKKDLLKYLKLISELIEQPKLVGLPYLYYKLSKFHRD